MSILITYPKNLVPVYLRLNLAKKNTVIYFPLRVFKPVELTKPALDQVQRAQHLVITSNYGLSVAVKLLPEINQNAIIHVLGQKAQLTLKNAGLTNPVQVAAEENRDAIVADLQAMGDEPILWLVGDLAKQELDGVPGQQLTIYQNEWDQQHEGKLYRILLKNKPQKILVTSVSSAKRLLAAMKTFDSTDEVHRIQYFVLGDKTGQFLEDKGLQVIYPTDKHQVLENVIKQMYD